MSWKGATATAYLSAHYAGAENLAYTARGLPAGANLDASTGQLTCTPAAAGSTVMTVTVSDGTTVASHHVVLAAAHNRSGAFALAEQGHDVDAEYVSDTEAAFDQALTTAQALGKKGTDDEYLAALTRLVTAVDGLYLVSPHTAVDRSLDHPSLVVTSTAGANIGNLVDGDNQSGTGYAQAVNLSHTFDFGLDFRVSATRFGFQSNIFADRLANSTVYGSNDGKKHRQRVPDRRAGEADDGRDAERGRRAGGVLDLFGGAPPYAFGFAVTPDAGGHDALVALVDGMVADRPPTR